MSSTEPDAEDADRGEMERRVRPYALTRGRTRPAAPLPVEALVLRVATESDPVGCQYEHRRILSLLDEPISVAEIGARLDLMLGVVRVLVGDLLAAGLVRCSVGLAGGGPAAPVSAADASQARIELLERVLHGLESL